MLISRMSARALDCGCNMKFVYLCLVQYIFLLCFTISTYGNSISLTETPKDFVDYSDIIAIGTVKDIQNTGSKMASCFSRQVRFEVAESWKGKGKRNIDFLTNDAELRVGSAYILFVRRWSGKEYEKSCGEMGSIESSKINLNYPLFMPNMILSRFPVLSKGGNQPYVAFVAEHCVGQYDVLFDGVNLQLPDQELVIQGRKEDCDYHVIRYEEMKSRVLRFLEE